MPDDEAQTRAALGRYWDAVVGAEPAPLHPVDPTLRATIRRLHAIDVQPTPDPAFVSRLEERLMNEYGENGKGGKYGKDAAIGRGRPPCLPVPRPTPSPSDRMRQAAGARQAAPLQPLAALPGHLSRVWPLLELAAALLLLALLGSYVVGHGRPAALIGPATGTTQLYVGSSTNTPLDAQRLTPLDPMTLHDRPDLPAIPLGDPSEHNVIAVWATARPPDYQPVPPTIAWAASADGSTIAEIVPIWTDFPPPSDPDTVQARDPFGAKATEILVRDGKTGAIRRTITPRGWFAWPQLSANGTRLLVENGSRQTALVYDTTRGALVTAVNFGHQVSPLPDGEWPTQAGPQAWLAPDLSRLYTLGPPSVYPAGTTPPAQLVAYDLTNGAVVGQLSLPGARTGVLQTKATIDGKLRAIPIVLQPGLALSPDGRQLAAVATVTGSVTVTLIDAAHLTIERTFTAALSTSLLHRALAWLGVTPRDAAAKDLGALAAPAAAYAPGGKSLYVFGSALNTTSPFPDRDLGIERIALDNGTITAMLRQGQGIDGISRVIPSPDGTSLYVITQGSALMLRRLDANTLTVQATRSFDALPWIVVRSGG